MQCILCNNQGTIITSFEKITTDISLQDVLSKSIADQYRKFKGHYEFPLVLKG